MPRTRDVQSLLLRRMGHPTTCVADAQQIAAAASPGARAAPAVIVGILTVEAAAVGIPTAAAANPSRASADRSATVAMTREKMRPVLISICFGEGTGHAVSCFQADDIARNFGFFFFCYAGGTLAQIKFA